jgi:hypothetical protein
MDYEKYLIEAGSSSMRGIKGKAVMEVAFGAPAIRVTDPKSGMSIRIVLPAKTEFLNLPKKFDTTFEVANFPI